jgi:WhiB family redox-sensing transcriptional regulator
VRRRPTGRPAVAATDDAWRDDAACSPDRTQVKPEDWFFPNEAKALRAKAVCARCPVRQPCLDYALRREQSWGVWGGLTSDERGTAY